MDAICLGYKPHTVSIRIKTPRQSFFVQFHIHSLVGIYHLVAQVAIGILVCDICNHISVMLDGHNLDRITYFKAVNLATNDNILQLHLFLIPSCPVCPCAFSIVHQELWNKVRRSNLTLST